MTGYMDQLPKSFFAARNPPRPPRRTSPPREGNLRSLKTAALVLFVIPLCAVSCRSPRIAYRTDPEVDRHAAIARSAYSAGLMANADLFYQKALNHARLMNKSVDIIHMAYNLAACRAQAQKYNEALELLDEAQLECDDTAFDFPEMRLLMAEILRCLGQTNDALAFALADLAALKNQENNPHRMQFQLLLAELACDRNDGKEALEELDKIDRRTLRAGASILQAREANVRGRALFIDHRPKEAAICFDNAATFYQEARHWLDMAKALQSAGNANEAADYHYKASNRYYRAARSFILQGENIKAQESFNNAERIARELSYNRMLSALARLKTEIGPDPENRISP